MRWVWILSRPSLTTALAAAVVLTQVSPARAEPASAEQPRCAVLPLKTSRIPKAAGAILDELLLSEVDRHGRYDVIGAADINAMLGLQKMKDTLGCSDVSCAAEIGGALGARYMLAGRVSRLGSSIVIVLKLIDTKEQGVLARARHRAKNDEDEYADALAKAVAKLFGGAAPTPSLLASAGASSETTADSGPGDLWIETDPPGAAVVVDGKERGKTPLRVTGLLTGPHKLSLEYSDHEPFENLVQVEAGRTVEIKERLISRFGSLAVDSEPSGAELFVGGARVGTTPAELHRIATGPRKVMLKLPGYATVTKTVEVRGGQTVRLSETLAQFVGSISLDSSPIGAGCMIDGKKLGVTPCKIDNVPIGRHAVEIRLPYFQPSSSNVLVENGQTARWTDRLTPLPVEVHVKTTPAAASLRLNGKHKGETPVRLKLTPGHEYKINVEKRGYRNLQESITIDPGLPVERVFELTAGQSDTEIAETKAAARWRKNFRTLTTGGAILCAVSWAVNGLRARSMSEDSKDLSAISDDPDAHARSIHRASVLADVSGVAAGILGGLSAYLSFTAEF